MSGPLVKMFREVVGPGFALGAPPARIERGDWLEASLFPRLPAQALRFLGPAISRARLEHRYKVRLDDQQVIFRPGGGSVAAPPVPSPEGAPFAFAIVTSTSPREAVAGLDLDNLDAVLLVDPAVFCPHGPEVLGERLARVMRASGADLVSATANAAEPAGLPMAGETASPHQRLPGGRSVWEVSEALADDASWAPCVPDHPPAVLLTRALARAVADGARPRPVRAVTAPAALCWRPEDEGCLRAILDLSPASAPEWTAVVDRVRARAARPVTHRPAVVLWSTAIGAWGGVAVLLRLADELQALGLHAFVAHAFTATTHTFPARTSPLKLRASSLLVESWQEVVGRRDGVLIASNWGAGKLARDIARANPQVSVTTFLQDREDRFEDRRGSEVGMREGFAEYLAVGRGVSVSRWVVESAASDLGLDPSGYEVICPGIDLDVFKPKLKSKAPARVRVLAMWRPMTDVRRGAALVRSVYADLRARFGGRVSLELFGWNEPSGPGRAPDYARHHGHLTPAQVAALMAEVDVVMEPSLFQGFGLPGLEAMACGAALASTRCLGVEEYAVHGDNALVVPHAELGAAVAQLIEDAALREQFRQRGIETAARFSWPLVAARWREYLARLAQ